ncbi:hypothetical protein H072_5602 [Dactylellina haptotyla CBS 200.50]|uniref:Uncharacterized protein n=1 Tax=Dactylellina haptotyla (strain CBS 200.50) TaxID=1284197 RepID=S8BYU0_DACHA|nr:hypothetical protein H072_5602 [Dactylellina haptotyla CBS 200.50]
MVDFELQHGNGAGEVDEYGLEFQPPDSIGVRSIDSTTMVDRLRDIAKLHKQSYSLNGNLDFESRALYGQLFTKLLYPPRKKSERIKTEDYSLGSQCRELFKILEERHVWLDFSRPEERIRLGSILYGNGEEKILLVLQILLSCELWARLQLLHKYEPEKLELEPLYFTPKASWDLAIAKIWLTNVRIVERPFTPDFEMLTPVPSTQKTSSWDRFFLTDDVSIEDPLDPQEVDTYDAFFVPQHMEKQLSGLLHFARKIDWPGIEMLEGVIRDKLRDPTGLYTPTSILGRRSPAHSPGKLTPRSVAGTTRSSYFGYSTSKHTSSAMVRNLGQGGWPSRTFTSGLVLPGEGLPHLLMGCLLENDSLALNEIGEHGSMYGGIIRKSLESDGKTSSWWSMNNIVGKVLATEDSQGTAGWVGKCIGLYAAGGTADEDITIVSAVAAKMMRNFSPTSPMGVYQRKGAKLIEPTGWVDVITDLHKRGYRPPRLSAPENIEQDSGFLGSNSLSGCRVPDEDIRFPESFPIQSAEVHLLGLRFWNYEGFFSTSGTRDLEEDYKPVGGDDTFGEIVPSYHVEIVFRLPGIDLGPDIAPHESERDIVCLPLRYDASFITSYPCYTQDAPELVLETVLSKSNLIPTSKHPIHAFYKYKVILATELLSHSPFQRGMSTEEEHFVTVINAKSIGKGFYVYAKAWCAKWGVDAIVSRSSRTCVSCAIREAYAIAVDVVIEY